MKKILLSLFIIGVLVGGIIVYLNLPKEKDNKNTKADSYTTVLAFSDKDKIMVVSEVDGYYIVDYNGNKKCKIEGSCDSSTFIMNNYIYTNKKLYSSNEYNYVFNSQGKEVYKTNGAIGGISESGYCLTEEQKESMSTGDSLQYNIIDLKNGNNVYSTDYTNVQNGFVKFKYSNYKDYFLKEELNAMVSGSLIDANTKEEYKNFAENKDYLEKESQILKNYNMPYYDGEKNYLGGTIINMENKLFLQDGKICNFDGKELKDISEGEVKYIFYYNNNILVITNTGYIYTLNKDLEYIVKPTKIASTELPKNILVDGAAIEEKINQPLTTNDMRFYITTAGLFYVSPSKGDNNSTKLNITIFDNETLKAVNKVELEVKDVKNDLIYTTNGLIINSSNDEVHILVKDEKIYEKSKVTKYSDNMVNISSNSEGTIVDLKNLKELKIK